MSKRGDRHNRGQQETDREKREKQRERGIYIDVEGDGK